MKVGSPSSKGGAVSASSASSAASAASGGRTKPSSVAGGLDEEEALIPARLVANQRQLALAKAAAAAAAGLLAGILRLSPIAGAACYLLSMAAAAAMYLLLRVPNARAHDYFGSGRAALFTDGVAQGVLSFVLFWTLSYSLFE
jgi:hypothetical protein